MLMNKFITTLLCLAGSAILFNANAVEREYTQFTAFQTSGSETIIPDGKYIMIAPNSSDKCRCMNPLKKGGLGTSSYGLDYVDASYLTSNNIKVNNNIKVKNAYTAEMPRTGQILFEEE